MNEVLGIEWLNKAYHHKGSAKILYDARHYTDVIAIDLHYAIEVTLKAILAYENKKIIKTHDLIELYKILKEKITFTEDELDLLDIVSTYHIRGSYPPKDKRLPSFEEIKTVLDFSEELFIKVCDILNIDKAQVEY
jgi:HEPN domain-containing protein